MLLKIGLKKRDINIILLIVVITLTVYFSTRFDVVFDAS